MMPYTFSTLPRARSVAERLTHGHREALHRRQTGRALVDDAQLPGLALLVDLDRLRDRLVSHRDWHVRRESSLEPMYVRYKPHTSCVIAYDLASPDAPEQKRLLYAKAYTEADFPQAQAKADRRAKASARPRAPVTSLEADRVLVYAFPNDAGLDALDLVSFPKKIQRILYRCADQYPESSWRLSDRRLRVTTIRYKPEKRAVIHLTTRAVHRQTGEKRTVVFYARTYADERGADIFERMQTIHMAAGRCDRLRVPRPLHYSGQRRWLFMEEVAGVPLLDATSSPRADLPVEPGAQALAAFHDLPADRIGGVTSRTRQDVLEDAFSAGRWLQSIGAGLQAPIDDVLQRLVRRAEQLAPVPWRLVHGDYHHGQILVSDRGSAIIDFDRTYLGDATADIGNFCAHMHVLQSEGRLDDGTAAADRFVAAYEGALGQSVPVDLLRFWTAIGLLQLAVRPARSLRADWIEASEALVHLSREIMR